MATRNKRKLAALNKEICEEHSRRHLAQNSNVPRSQEDYITQVSQEIEGRVTKKLSQEFSRTENRILGALARLDDFLMNPLIPGLSGTTPEKPRNAFGTNRGTNEDHSQSDPHPEAGIFGNQITKSFGPEDDHYITKCCNFRVECASNEWYYFFKMSFHLICKVFWLKIRKILKLPKWQNMMKERSIFKKKKLSSFKKAS